MCLFLAIPTADGYILWSQRDDQKDRKTSSIVSFDKRKQYQYIQDEQSGWTRFAYHTDGIYTVLINKAPSLYDTSWIQTRGKLPLQCMEWISNKKSISQIIHEILSDLESYNSFTLSIGRFKNNQLKHTILERDAIQQKSQQYNRFWSLFLSASTLYTHEAHAKRMTDSLQLTNRDELVSFLKNRQYNTESSNCISKQWVITKSRTIVEYTTNKPIMYKYKGDI